MKRFQKKIQWDRYGLVLALFVWCILITILEPVFISSTNLFNVLRQISIVSVIAVGSFLVILSGGIDLSVGSVTALSGVVAAIVMKNLNMPVYMGIICGIIAGSFIGSLNGLMVTKIKIPPFIATLITMNFAKGLAFIFTDGTPVSGLSSTFIFIGRGYIWFIPFPIIIMLFIYVVAAYVMKKSRFGLRVYGIGGNIEAVRLSGVQVLKYLFSVYLLSGAFSGMAGVILASRLNSGSPNVGASFVFTAITAVVLGGTSLMGGEGRIMRVLLGSVFMGTISNALNLLNVPSYYQLVANAIILLIAMIIDVQAKRIK